MYIYKITNLINNKIYIGQTYNKTIYDRFARHIKEANPNHPILLDRAIYKYGADNFIIEQIDEAENLTELNNKEIYWIKFYNSTNCNIGYNLTTGGEGGNTYLCKTNDELQEIKNKISKSNSGKNNGNAKSIKALNVKTNEIIHFDTLNDCCKYFNYTHKQTFTAHCNKKAISLWKKEWTFAYENDTFNTLLDITPHPNRKPIPVKLIDLATNNEQIFKSINSVLKYINYSKKIHFINNICIIGNYKIIKL